MAAPAYRLPDRKEKLRKDFREIVRLTWAQEASGSNPDASTKSFQINHLQMDNFGHCCILVQRGNNKKIPS